MSRHSGLTHKSVEAELDLAHLVHPMTDHAGLTPENLTVFREARGITLRDTRGYKYVDAMAGLMNVHIGYGRQEMADAAAQSMKDLSYAPLFFGYSNAPAAHLAAKLATITPNGIDRFFFTLTGSDAIDTAIKLARLQNSLRGEPQKNCIISRRQGYHGLTLAAMNATGQPELWEGFGPRVPGFSYVDQPIDSQSAADALALAIEDAGGAKTVAAFIAEPVSVPAGVHLPPPGYWRAIREVCDAHDVLLIIDEVITGFGRTGNMFGCDTYEIRPDLLVLSKGLTSGYQPLGAVGMTAEIYERITPSGRSFMHGFTSSGHPVACSVALRNIDILEDEDLINRAATRGVYLRQRLHEACEASNNFGEIRGVGLLVALDVGLRGRDEAECTREAGTVAADLRQHRLLLRRYGATLVLAPAFIVTEQEIDLIVGTIETALKRCRASAVL